MCTGRSSFLEESTARSLVIFLIFSTFQVFFEAFHLITEARQEQGGLSDSTGFPPGFELVFVKPNGQPLYNPATTGTFVTTVVEG